MRIAAIVFAVLLLSGCFSDPENDTFWEYRTIYGEVSGDYGRLDDAINLKVKEGWDFVASLGTKENTAFALLRRRKKKEFPADR